jgi:hypothetical protein
MKPKTTTRDFPTLSAMRDHYRELHHLTEALSDGAREREDQFEADLAAGLLTIRGEQVRRIFRGHERESIHPLTVPWNPDFAWRSSRQAQGLLCVNDRGICLHCGEAVRFAGSPSPGAQRWLLVLAGAGVAVERGELGGARG